jgi:hypothetical protein
MVSAPSHDVDVLLTNGSPLEMLGTVLTALVAVLAVVVLLLTLTTWIRGGGRNPPTF